MAHFRPSLHSQRLTSGCTLVHNKPRSLVLSAIDSGNLKSVAMNARQKWPNAEIIIAGDDDRMSDYNVGAIKAKAAARRMFVQVYPDYSEPCNLWIITALPSGSRKSAVQSGATAPLVEWEREKAASLEDKSITLQVKSRPWRTV